MFSEGSYTIRKNLNYAYKYIQMDRSKVRTLKECLDTIDSMEKICVDKFKPRVCKNLQSYYFHYCYKTFEDKPVNVESKPNFEIR